LFPFVDVSFDAFICSKGVKEGEEENDGVEQLLTVIHILFADGITGTDEDVILIPKADA
jgi:hypothetical protein